MNLDDFFIAQNDRFTVDTSKQDLHWQKMQEQLHKPRSKKYWKPLAIAALLVVVATTIIVLSTNKDKTTKDAVALTTTTNTTTSPTTTQKDLETSTPEENKTINTISINPKSIETITKKQNTATLTSPVVASSLIQKQAQFYVDLTKAPEVFEIDPTIENTVTCKQGTKITIPANSIADAEGNAIAEKISLIVQEYYRYDGKIADNGKKTATAGMIKYEVYKDAERLSIMNTKTVAINMNNGLQNFKIISSEDALSEKQLLQLNWISNERFYTDKRPKIDYKITLDAKYDANTFMSQIAFPRYNALLPGNIENNSLIFNNIPVGENIYFISIGKIGDKYFSCSKKLVSGNTSIKEMDFVEISETLYKQQIDMYGKLGKND